MATEPGEDKGVIEEAKAAVSDACDAVVEGAGHASVDSAAAALGGAEAYEDPKAARDNAGSETADFERDENR